jgi:hypothetical protein
VWLHLHHVAEEPYELLLEDADGEEEGRAILDSVIQTQAGNIGSRASQATRRCGIHKKIFSVTSEEALSPQEAK